MTTREAAEAIAEQYDLRNAYKERYIGEVESLITTISAAIADGVDGKYAKFSLQELKALDELEEQEDNDDDFGYVTC